MKKLGLLTALITMTAQLHAYEIDTTACAGIEHIEDQSGAVVPYDSAVHTFVTANTQVYYAGEEQIPHLEIEENTHTTIFVTNTTNSVVSFFYKPTFKHLTTGASISTPSPIYNGNFSNANDPLSSQGANMPPNSAGTIFHSRGTSNSFGNSVIQWDSSTCFDIPPLITTVRVMWHRWLKSYSGTSASYFMVNNGKNW